MGGQLTRPQVYTRFFSVRLKPGDVEKLEAIAVKKRYSSDTGSMGNKLKQPRIGITRLIREIIEEYLSKAP